MRKLIIRINYGNTLAIKNQIAKNIWITDAIRITEPMKAKLNCLENAPQERVGMKFIRKS